MSLPELTMTPVQNELFLECEERLEKWGMENISWTDAVHLPETSDSKVRDSVHEMYKILSVFGDAFLYDFSDMRRKKAKENISVLKSSTGRFLLNYSISDIAFYHPEETLVHAMRRVFWTTQLVWHELSKGGDYWTSKPCSDCELERFYMHEPTEEEKEKVYREVYCSVLRVLMSDTLRIEKAVLDDVTYNSHGHDESFILVYKVVKDLQVRFAEKWKTSTDKEEAEAFINNISSLEDSVKEIFFLQEKLEYHGHEKIWYGGMNSLNNSGNHRSKKFKEMQEVNGACAWWHLGCRLYVLTNEDTLVGDLSGDSDEE